MSRPEKSGFGPRRVAVGQWLVSGWSVFHNKHCDFSRLVTRKKSKKHDL